MPDATPQVTIEFVEAAVKRFCQKLEAMPGEGEVDCSNVDHYRLTYDVNLMYRSGFKGTVDEALEELDNNVGLDSFGIIVW